jgi:hypothetical protein
LILVGKKILVKPEQALGYSWNNKNKTHKLISYVVVRREEKRREEKKIKQYKYDIRFIYSLQFCPMILEINMSLNTTNLSFFFL